MLTWAEVVGSFDRTHIYVPKYDQVKRDATGAFHIGARQFVDYTFSHKNFLLRHRNIHYINNKKPFATRGDELLSIMEEAFPTPVLHVFFCHGWATGMQLGITSPGSKWSDNFSDMRWTKFLELLSRGGICTTVVLFACSTGEDPLLAKDNRLKNTAPGTPLQGDRSFGDLLRDGLVQRGCSHCRVVTHVTEGHSWQNPNVRFFEGNAMPSTAADQYGGIDLFRPGEGAIKQTFRNMISFQPKHPHYGFAWKFPFMSIDDIRKSAIVGRNE